MFLRKRQAIPARSRNLIHKEAAVFPSAMLHSRRAARHILSTDARNLICQYHRDFDKKGDTWDGGGESARKYRFVTGTPRMRQVAKTNSEPVKACEPGFLNCGCPEDAVLLEAALRKITRVRSDQSGTQETWQGKVLAPRDRLFLATIFNDWTGLTVEDLFQSNSKGGLQSYADLLDKQISILQERRKGLAQFSAKPSNPSFDDGGAASAQCDDSDSDLIAILAAEKAKRQAATDDMDCYEDIEFESDSEKLGED